MSLPEWNPENLREVCQEILLKASDPVAAKKYRENLCNPEFAKAELKMRISEPPHGWGEHLVAFENMVGEPKNERMDIFTLPLSADDAGYLERRACSYNRTYLQ